MHYFLLAALLFTPLSSSIEHQHHQIRRPANERHRRRLLGDPGGVPSFHKPAPDRWFHQKLDHFDPLVNETWLQRYQVNETFFSRRADSPVFLMVGGEGAISAKWMAAGAWQVYAEKYGALCLQLEHRYYGKSWPKPDMSTENLRFLSSQQALADIAYFIEGINDMYNLTSSNYWVLFGGSYPGALAAWARSKYAHLVHQSISSSGPLEAVADFPQYNEVVSDALDSVSPDCVDQTHQAALQLEKTVKHPIGGVLVTKMFNLCKPLNVASNKDVSTLAEALSGNFDEVVQYNNDNRITSDPKPLLTMNDLCEIMINRSMGSPMERYAAVNRMVLKRNNQTCLDASYKQAVKDLQNMTFNPEEGARQWTYQTCTEFGFYQTSSSRKELFGSLFNVDYFVEQCQDVFGDDFGKDRLMSGIERTNILYGGKGISTSRVMFVHGSVDPWHVLGITESDNHSLPAIFMVGTAHCADMYPPSDRDLEALTRARVSISNHIGQWLMRPRHSC